MCVYLYIYIYMYEYDCRCIHIGFLLSLRVYLVEAAIILIKLSSSDFIYQPSGARDLGGTQPFFHGKNGMLMSLQFILFALINPIHLVFYAPLKSWFSRGFTHNWHHLGDI